MHSRDRTASLQVSDAKSQVDHALTGVSAFARFVRGGVLTSIAQLLGRLD
jgi:hypothetical protein